MAKVTREGRFLATIFENSVDSSGENKLAAFIAKYRLVAEWMEGEWADVSGEEMEALGYHYLELKNGGVNEYTYKDLKAALGWDGMDPLWLADTDLGNLVVQVVIKRDEYMGKVKFKVDMIRPQQWTGGLTKASDETRASIRERLGAKFRAMSTPISTPAPSGAPTLPPVVLPPHPVAWTADTAYAEFVEIANAKCIPGHGFREDYIQSEFARLLNDAFPDTPPTHINHASWAAFLADAPSKIVPF